MSKPIPKMTVAQFITDRLSLIDKTQMEIATELGLRYPNAIGMIADGTVKLPISYITALAEAIGTDPAYLLRLVLSEYVPEVLKLVENVLQRPLYTANEVALVKGFREVTGDRNVRSVVVERDGMLEVLVLNYA